MSREIKNSQFEEMEEIEFQKDVCKIVRGYLGENVKIFLFGSRAVNKDNKRSDYDIAILSDFPIPFDIMGHIEEDIDSLVLQKVDLIDLRRVNSDFRSKALENSIQWI